MKKILILFIFLININSFNSPLAKSGGGNGHSHHNSKSKSNGHHEYISRSNSVIYSNSTHGNNSSENSQLEQKHNTFIKKEVYKPKDPMEIVYILSFFTTLLLTIHYSCKIINNYYKKQKKNN